MPLTNALRAFATGWVSGTYLATSFHRVRQASDWLSLLDLINLGDNVTLGKLVHIVHVPGAGPSCPGAEVQRNYWQSRLGRTVLPAANPLPPEFQCSAHIRGTVNVDIDRERLGPLQSPLKRIANFEGVRLALVAVLCRLPDVFIKGPLDQRVTDSP